MMRSKTSPKFVKSKFTKFAQFDRQYVKGLVFSVGIHCLLLALLLFSIETHVKPQGLPKPKGAIVQAAIVDEKQVDAEFHRLAEIDASKKLEEQKKTEARNAELKQIQKMKQMEEQKLADIKLAREKEKKELEALKEEQAKEKKRLAALEERRQEEQDRAHAMRLEREKEEKKQTELAAKKKQEEKRKLEEEKRKLESENRLETLKAQRNPDIETEGDRGAGAEETLSNMREARIQRLNDDIEKYDALMKQKINQAWMRPPGLPSGLSCELYARLLPDGTVVSPQIKRSSGNAAFDQAAMSALERATPLPMPSDPALLDEFRQFNFRFSPPEET